MNDNSILWMVILSNVSAFLLGIIAGVSFFIL